MPPNTWLGGAVDWGVLAERQLPVTGTLIGRRNFQNMPFWLAGTVVGTTWDMF